MKKRTALTEKMTVGEGILIYTPVILFVIMCLVPFVVLISSSFTDSDYLKYNGATLIPHGFTLAAYKTVFLRPSEILTAYGVSIFVTVVGTVLNVLLSVMVAYPISRLNFRFNKAVSLYFYISMIFNAGLIPTYIVLQKLNLIDTIWVMIFPPLVIVGYIFTLKVFFVAVPDGIVESARIDGASEGRILFQIAVPLVKPGIATIAFYTVLFYWNDPNMALYYTMKTELTPIALYMTRISNYIEAIKWAKQQGTFVVDFEVPEDSIIYATAIVTSGPMLFVFSLFQKYFVQGLTSGGVKG